MGAGFATGQEILQFFTAFGLNGLWGIILTTILLIIFGVIIMELGFTLHAQSHLDIIKQSGGKVFGSAIDLIITFFLFGSLTAMMAGTGALFSQQFGLTGILGNLVMAILTAMTVLTGIKGVINAISAVVPFLLVSVIGISVFSIIKTPPDLTGYTGVEGNGLIGNWALSAILYTSYNTVVSIAILGPLGASAGGRKAVVRGGVLGGLGLGISSVMIYLALWGNLSDIKDLEVPMVYIAGCISPMVQMMYAVVLIAEIYTTAVGALYGFTARVVQLKKSPKNTVIVIGTSVAAFFASLSGFSNLVKYLYPLVGYAGIALLISLLYNNIKSKRAGGSI